MLKDILEQAATDIDTLEQMSISLTLKRYSFLILIASVALGVAFIWLFPCVKDIVLWLLVLGYISKWINTFIAFMFSTWLKRKWSK